MINEKKGTIKKLIDNYGYILGEDNNEYLFLKSDLIDYQNLKINDTVIFKPIYLKDLNLYKAVLIEKQ